MDIWNLYVKNSQNCQFWPKNGQGYRGVSGQKIKLILYERVFISFSALFTELKNDVVCRNCATAKLGRYFRKLAFPLYFPYIKSGQNMTPKPIFCTQNFDFSGPKLHYVWFKIAIFADFEVHIMQFWTRKIKISKFFRITFLYHPKSYLHAKK